MFNGAFKAKHKFQHISLSLSELQVLLVAYSGCFTFQYLFFKMTLAHTYSHHHISVLAYLSN